MSYEQFRNDCVLRMSDMMGTDAINRILSIIDSVASSYNMTRKTTDLTVVSGDLPQIVKLHLAAKAIENKSKETLKDRMYILKNFFSAVKISYDKVTSNDIRSYLYQYKQNRNVSNRSLNIIRSNIRCFYQWCVDEEYLPRNPAAKVGVIKSQPNERHSLTQLQLETMRSVCKPGREKAMIDFLFSTGCRVSEMCDVKLEDVDMDNRTVIVWHGKGDKKRIVYLNAEAVISIRRYLATRHDGCPYLFVSEHLPAHHIGRDAIENSFRNIIKRMEKQNSPITPHVMRHTTATTALQSGMPIEQVQKLLGHSKIDTTMIYAEVSQDDVKRSHERFLA